MGAVGRLSQVRKRGALLLIAALALTSCNDSSPTPTSFGGSPPRRVGGPSRLEDTRRTRGHLPTDRPEDGAILRAPARSGGLLRNPHRRLLAGPRQRVDLHPIVRATSTPHAVRQPSRSALLHRRCQAIGPRSCRRPERSPSGRVIHCGCARPRRRRCPAGNDPLRPCRDTPALDALSCRSPRHAPMNGHMRRTVRDSRSW